MGITLGTNIASLKAQRQLFQTGETLGTVFERLASGQRINRASDDAAGLAIASSLNADRRVASKAILNINDGLSALSIADSAIDELGNVVIRIAELAEQAANGTYTLTQRQAMESEGQALRSEYNRIAATTEFNDLSLLASQTNSLSIQAGLTGASTDQVQVDFGIGVNRTVGDGTWGDVQNIGANLVTGLAIGDINNDGNSDIVGHGAGPIRTMLFGNGDGSFQSAVTQNNVGSYRYLKLADFNNDGNLDILGNQNAANAINIEFGNGDGTFGPVIGLSTTEFGTSLGDLNNDGFLDFIAGNGTNTFGVYLNNQQGGFNRQELTLPGTSAVLADFDNDGNTDVLLGSSGSFQVLRGQGDGTFGEVYLEGTTSSSGTSLAVGDFNDDGYSDITVMHSSSQAIDVFINNGDGSVTSNLNQFNGYGGGDIDIADVNGDGLSDIVLREDTNAWLLLSNGDGTFGVGDSITTADSGQVALGDLNNDGVADVAVRDSTNNIIHTALANTTLSATLESFHLLTSDQALSTLDLMRDVSTRLNQQRGVVGVNQGILSVAVSNMNTLRVNFAQAENRILSADMAEESAQLVRNNILQQAASSVLAQANQQPALALQLLGGG